MPKKDNTASARPATLPATIFPCRVPRHSLREAKSLRLAVLHFVSTLRVQASLVLAVFSVDRQCETRRYDMTDNGGILGRAVPVLTFGAD
ncbi:hypothetical protein [Rhizobium sp. L1K21]|uniref:hypothetical protein n=1 Tax=Rhizobium sp. L1K21 TaxID=2954933 RepID=UPI0020931834|nr:hypothetical protein [Rhizobium sp. L1K21]MCO6188512.1 hypothetical protein [Rhizobium sp. L1K21]